MENEKPDNKVHIPIGKIVTFKVIKVGGKKPKEKPKMEIVRDEPEPIVPSDPKNQRDRKYN